MNWENHFEKIRSRNKNNAENQSQNAACEQNITGEKGKFGSIKKLDLE